MTTKATKNAKGGGTIRKRSDGRWEARYTLGIDPKTGKQIQKSVYGKTQKEVRQKLTAITAEIGSMKVTEQIDALRVMATDPVGYLVVPRFVACILMTPMIVTFANFMGIAGGLFVAMTHTNVSAYSFIHSIETFTELSDFTGGLIKSMFFGGIVALVGCIKGMGAKEGAEGVGHATTGSVVTSIVWIFVINFFLSTWLFR